MERSDWFTPRAWGLHLTLLVTVPTFLALCWWQVTRALSGNELSWAYVFEWPFFAAYAVYLWWKLVHDPPGAPRAVAGDRAAPIEAGGAAREPGVESVADGELDAYNRYLAALEASGRRKHW